MQTILYDSPVFGPVHSRRLGTSLGINLIPETVKICNFNCIYCECGLNEQHSFASGYTSLELLRKELDRTLQTFARSSISSQGTANSQEPKQHLDVITFAGNGEPTAHPSFDYAVEIVCDLRDRYVPDAKISVLTNGTRAHYDSVHHALLKVDNNIVKLDSTDPVFIDRINAPVNSFDIQRLIQTYASFEGHCIVQTMFLHGTDAHGNPVDNTDAAHVSAWLDALRRIKPSAVEVYTIARNTPLDTLSKASPQELDAITTQVRSLGLSCNVSY